MAISHWLAMNWRRSTREIRSCAHAGGRIIKDDYPPRSVFTRACFSGRAGFIAPYHVIFEFRPIESALSTATLPNRTGCNYHRDLVLRNCFCGFLCSWLCGQSLCGATRAIQCHSSLSLTQFLKTFSCLDLLLLLCAKDGPVL